MTGQELARRSRLSRRFLSEVEAGRANISIGRLEGLAAALGMRPERLISGRRPAGPRQAIDRLLAGLEGAELSRVLALLELILGERRPRALALLGIRGAGKSSVGPLVAEGLELPFVELDERIESAAGLRLAEIFALHGEPYYRRLEARCLAELLASGSDQACVVALPGGVVGNDEAFALARAACVCAWLKARPEDLMARVLAQGDQRPMAGSVDAMAELRTLAAAREPLYRQADVVVDTSAGTCREVASQLLSELVRGSFGAFS